MAAPESPEQAARFLYLNRTAYGGLWRENKSGQMNAPCSKDAPNWLPTSQYRAAATLLAKPGIQIKCQPFQETIAQAKQGDLIYADPPYIPRTNEFTAYQKTGFTRQDHEHLAQALQAAQARGAQWVLSNSDTTATREIYNTGTPTQINADRRIGHPNSTKKHAKEIIIASN